MQRLPDRQRRQMHIILGDVGGALDLPGGADLFNVIGVCLYGSGGVNGVGEIGNVLGIVRWMCVCMRRGNAHRLPKDAPARPPL